MESLVSTPTVQLLEESDKENWSSGTSLIGASIRWRNKIPPSDHSRGRSSGSSRGWPAGGLHPQTPEGCTTMVQCEGGNDHVGVLVYRLNNSKNKILSVLLTKVFKENIADYIC